MTNAEDLKCGNVIEFRDKRYVVLASVTDKRATYTALICTEEHNIKAVTSLFLFRTYKVPIVYNMELTIERFDNTKDEITQEMIDELEFLRDRS